jgi:hydrogenase expression/formation protein HypE
MKLDLTSGRVELTHGGGGRAMATLVEGLFKEAFSNPMLDAGNDQACFVAPQGKMVMTTDGYVIHPLFFPGGDIGSLAVHGTVNDVAMGGAKPLYLSAGFILEEGFPLADLKRIVDSMATASREAGVPIVTGDTKVVERGKADGVFITTAGVGVVYDGVAVSAERAAVGDKIIVSGTIGDHGVAILSVREGLEFGTEIRSDSAALHGLVETMVQTAPDMHVLRDPTRGGVAATLNELSHAAGVGMVLQESAIPILPEVRGACELLGLDPLYVANEGKLLCICPAASADALVTAMRAHPLGQDAAIIGEVIEDPHQFVTMETAFGGRRVVDWLAGEQLPRIC